MSERWTRPRSHYESYNLLSCKIASNYNAMFVASDAERLYILLITAEFTVITNRNYQVGWHSTVVECRYFTGELSLSCACPTVDG